MKLNQWVNFISALVFSSKSSHPEVFIGKGVLKICSKFTGKRPVEVRFQQSSKATLLKSHFGMSVVL